MAVPQSWILRLLQLESPVALRVQLAAEPPPWHFRQRGGGGSTESTAPPAPRGRCPGSLPGTSAHIHRPHCCWRGWGHCCPRGVRVLLLRKERRTDIGPGHSYYHPNSCWFLVFFFFPENCRGVGAYLYTLNFFAYQRSTDRFPQSILDLGTGTRVRRHGHKIKQIQSQVHAGASESSEFTPQVHTWETRTQKWRELNEVLQLFKIRCSG